MGCASLNFGTPCAFMLLCLAIPAWSHVGTVRGHRAVSVSLCLMCHCQKRSEGSGFLQEGNGEEGAGCRAACSPHHWSFCPSWYPVLPGATGTGQPWACGMSAAGAGLCSSSASVSLYTRWQTLCSPQQYCRQTFGFVGGDFEAVLLAAKHSTNCLQLPHPLQPPVSSPQSSRRDVCSYPQWMCSSCGMQCRPTHRSPHFLCSSCSG